MNGTQMTLIKRINADLILNGAKWSVCGEATTRNERQNHM